MTCGDPAYCFSGDLCGGCGKDRDDADGLRAALAAVEAELRSWEGERYTKPGREGEWTRLLVRRMRSVLAAVDG